MAIFRLDYLSCLLTILATLLMGRKMWPGLVISIVNSLIVCFIGFHTSQFGFIPANVFCIGINAYSIRSWRSKQLQAISNEVRQTISDLIADVPRMSASTQPSVRRFNGFHATLAKIGSINPLSSLFAKIRSTENAYLN